MNADTRRSIVKAITFDLDGVYFVNGKSNFIASLSRLGVSEGEAKRVFFDSDEMNSRYKAGTMSDGEFWSWALKEWDVDLSVEEIVKLLIEGYETNQQVLGVVKDARNRGYKTLVCSNNFPARIQGLQARFGFLDNFDAAAISYEIGATKPSQAIFRELVKRSGVNAEEIVFADDDESKLSGARAIGMQTFVYKGFDEFLVSLRNLGVVI